MNSKIHPAAVFAEYENGVAYNNAIALYETVEQNENFFLGKQWEGLNAPDLDKPTLNFLKRVIAYFVAMIVSDDIAVDISPFPGGGGEPLAKALSGEIERIFEEQKMSAKLRDALRDAAVCGDGCFYFWYDPAHRGISVERCDNTRVLFGNPYTPEIEKQPSIILVQPMLTETVKRQAREAGIDPDLIRPDEEPDGESAPGAPRTTVLLRLWKEEGTVRYCRVIRGAVLKGPVDTGYSRYPLAFFNWERVRDSYHGRAALTGLIPNQIAVNKLWAMALRCQQMLAFPKVFYDRLKIREWSNRVGEAIGVAGSPGEAIATDFRAGDMSAQLLEIVDRTIEYSRDFLGASDAALGNIRPDNYSAIIAVQKASSAPLDLQRLAFYQFVEDGVRILCDMILTDYGRRAAELRDGESVWVDYASADRSALSLKVEIGPAAYWSELMQVQTMDNLFAKGVITDALTYLEGVPEGYLHNREELVEKLKAAKTEGVYQHELSKL